MKPASGFLGALTGAVFVTMLERAELSGTLFLERGERSALLLLQEGRLAAHHNLGQALALEDAEARFTLLPHGPSPLPRLLPRYPEGQVDVLRALPALLEEPPRTTNETDLRALVTRLAQARSTGGLVLTTETHQGLLMFHGGRLGAAFFEEEGRLRQGSSALRAALQETQGAQLTLHPLPGLVSASLLGLALGLGAEQDSTFSGLEVSAEGYTFYRAGSPYLHLLTSPLGASGFFALCQHAPNLVLPTESPGWERQRYGLTLRGRDALNPMTELAMHFRGEFGKIGQRTLEQFRRALSVEDAAEKLTLELADLKPYVERLEVEGFIRRVS